MHYPQAHRRSMALTAIALTFVAACEKPALERVTAPAAQPLYGVPPIECEPSTDPDCEPPPPPPPPPPNPRYGLVPSGWEMADPLYGPRLARLVAEANAGWARVSLYWAKMQPQGPSFDPDELAMAKRAVQHLTDAGLNVYVTLEATPAWARHCELRPDGTQWTWEDPSVPCGTKHTAPPHESMWIWWREFVAAMVAEFPSVNYWGVWNEPNAREFLNPPIESPLEAYRKLVGYAADAIRVVPGKKLVAPELGSGGDNPTPQEWLRQFLQTDGWRTDVVSVHHYGLSWEAEKRMREYSNIGALYGAAPIWATEVAGREDASDAEQASHLGDVYRRMDSGAVPRWEKTFYFHLYADGWQLVNNATSEVPQRRPAYNCFKARARWAPAPSYCYPP